MLFHVNVKIITALKAEKVHNGEKVQNYMEKLYTLQLVIQINVQRISRGDVLFAFEMIVLQVKLIMSISKKIYINL